MSQSGPPADAKQAQAAALTELENATRRKRAIDTNLANLETSIWAFEGSYLDETASSGGNIIKGFDNYLKPPTSQNKKKVDNTEVDRLFSTSSVTFQQSLAARFAARSAPISTPSLPRAFDPGHPYRPYYGVNAVQGWHHVGQGQATRVAGGEVGASGSSAIPAAPSTGYGVGAYVPRAHTSPVAQPPTPLPPYLPTTDVMAAPEQKDKRRRSRSNRGTRRR